MCLPMGDISQCLPKYAPVAGPTRFRERLDLVARSWPLDVLRISCSMNEMQKSSLLIYILTFSDPKAGKRLLRKAEVILLTIGYGSVPSQQHDTACSISIERRKLGALTAHAFLALAELLFFWLLCALSAILNQNGWKNLEKKVTIKS